MAKNRRDLDNVKTQTPNIAHAELDVKTQDAAVTHAEPKLKFQINPVRVNFALIRPTNFFRHKSQVIEMDINGRNVCQRCGGVCGVTSLQHHSSDGDPKKMRWIKCKDCGASDKIPISTRAPYELLTPGGKDSPLASVLLHVAALAEKMPTFTDEEQQHISDELEAKLREFIQPV